MSDERYNIEAGEDKAWRELASASPAEVAKRSRAAYDPPDGTYTLTVLGEDYIIDPARRRVENISNPARRPEYFLNLAAPIYMVQAKDIKPSGELVKELKGGEFFFRGSHALPLDAVARKFGRDKALFEEAGRSLGGTPVEAGDAAFTFSVFPMVSMTFVLWTEDDEFPARASLLFDSNAGAHMALDVVWAMALLSCQRMLGYGRG